MREEEEGKLLEETEAVALTSAVRALTRADVPDPPPPETAEMEGVNPAVAGARASLRDASHARGHLKCSVWHQEKIIFDRREGA